MPSPKVYNVCWLVLSDEQMSKGWPFSLLNDEQMSNWLGVEHQPVWYLVIQFARCPNQPMSEP